jgi:hypothetical protein
MGKNGKPCMWKTNPDTIIVLEIDCWKETKEHKLKITPRKRLERKDFSVTPSLTSSLYGRLHGCTICHLSKHGPTIYYRNKKNNNQNQTNNNKRNTK